MIDFSLTEEQKLFQQNIKNFAEKEIMPIASECDEKEEFPVDIFGKIGALGYLGLRFPEEYGGSNLSRIYSVIMAEELAYSSAGIALGIYVHLFLALTAISAFGNEEQKKKYLVPGIKGEKIGCWGFAEPNAGSDPDSITTRAVKDENSYIINGTKTFITNGGFADFVVVTAKTDPALGLKGMSLLIIDKGSEGFSVSKKLKKLGMRASDTAELVFEDCRIPETSVLGEENKGFLGAMKTLTEGRIVAAAFATGLARAAFDAALRYAKERVQFGQPIGKFQGIQWMLSDMALQVEAARLLTYKAAWLADGGMPHIKEASFAKLFATEACTRITEKALQIHGGYGFIMESPAQRFYRDCKLLEIGEGTSQIHRNIIAKQLGL